MSIEIRDTGVTFSFKNGMKVDVSPELIEEENQDDSYYTLLTTVINNNGKRTTYRGLSAEDFVVIMNKVKIS